MKKFVAIPLALFLASCATRHSPMCEALSSTDHVSGPNLTVSQVEKIGVAIAAENPAGAQVPFTLANGDWENLKSKYAHGDTLRAFDGPRWQDGEPIAGGYILLRGQCVIAKFVVWKS